MKNNFFTARTIPTVVLMAVFVWMLWNTYEAASLNKRYKALIVMREAVLKDEKELYKQSKQINLELSNLYRRFEQYLDQQAKKVQ